MADIIPTTPEDSAEKAYAEAAQTVAVVDAPVEAPAVVEAAPVVETPVAEVAAAVPVAAPKAKPVPKPAAVKVAKPAVAEAVVAPAPKLRKAAKPAAKTITRKVKVAAPKPVTAKTAPKAAPKPVAAKIAATLKTPSVSKLKDTIMATAKTKTTDFTADIKSAAAGVQEKAKAVFAKGSEVVSEATEFAKGNVEAVVASGKILAAGVQDLGTTYVAEGKSAFETLTADVKAFAAVKSPTDFFKLQSEVLRRNFDAAVATGSKNSEAFIKLANETVAPISGRVSLVIEKVKKAA
jgi:hypothetical protein